MSVNKWSADTQTLTTLAGVDREAIDSLSQEITNLKDNSSGINLMRFAKFKSNKGGRIESVLIDGKYLYATCGKFICKYDISIEVDPQFIGALEITPSGANATDLPSGGTSAFYNGGASFIVKNMSHNSNYIFVTMRHNAGIKADGTLYYGGFAVIKKSDFTVVKTIWTLSLDTSSKLNGNILAIGGQIWGIHFYDVTNAENPTLLKEFEYQYKLDTDGVTKVHNGYPNYASITTKSYKMGHESQCGKFMSDGTKLYYIDIGFGAGFNIYDVTDTSNITEVAEWSQVKEPVFDGTTSSHPTFHTMECQCDYPYMYITCARTTNDDTTVENCGVITFDMSDIANPTWIDKALINPSDIETFTVGADPEPTHMIKYGRTLILNYEKGVLVFTISADKKSCKYVGKYKPSEDFEVYDLEVADDGRIAMSGKSKPYPTSIYVYRSI